MKQEYEVSLENVMIYAYHGVFEHERKDGNEFELNLCVKYYAEDTDDDIEKTVSYADLWEIAKSEIAEPRKLLETVANEIVKKVSERYPQIHFIECRLTKINPPIRGFEGSASVTVRRYG